MTLTQHEKTRNRCTCQSEFYMPTLQGLACNILGTSWYNKGEVWNNPPRSGRLRLSILPFVPHNMPKNPPKLCEMTRMVETVEYQSIPHSLYIFLQTTSPSPASFSPFSACTVSCPSRGSASSSMWSGELFYFIILWILVFPMREIHQKIKFRPELEQTLKHIWIFAITNIPFSPTWLWNK